MKKKSIAILLSSYNGEKYIQEQLDSLESQTYKTFDLFIRDDFSSDNTVSIIEKFIKKSSLHVKNISSNENLGAMRSFEALIKEALKYSHYEIFMLCDQDDVWFSDKVENTLRVFNTSIAKQKPFLLYTDLEVVDENLNILASSFWDYFNLDPSLNSLNRLSMQCNVTGCTMMFNRKIAEISLPFSDKTVMHDHWLGLVASSMGEIRYIHQSTLSYRQHALNVSGGAEHFGWSYILKKASKYFNTNEYYEVLGRQIEQSKAFLNIYKQNLSVKNKEILEAIILLENSNLFYRIYLIIRFKLYKQGFIRNIGLFLWLLKIGIFSK